MRARLSRDVAPPADQPADGQPRDDEFVADDLEVEQRPDNRQQHPELGQMHPALRRLRVAQPLQPEDEQDARREVREFDKVESH